MSPSWCALSLLIPNLNLLKLELILNKFENVPPGLIPIEIYDLTDCYLEKRAGNYYYIHLMPKASNGYDGNGCLNLSGTCFSFKTMKLNLLGANKSSLHRMMLRDKHVNFLTPTISLTNPLWPLFPNFAPTIIEAHLPPKLANIRLKYRTCTIITRGLYTFYQLLEGHFFIFKEVF